MSDLPPRNVTPFPGSIRVDRIVDPDAPTAEIINLFGPEELETEQRLRLTAESAIVQLRGEIDRLKNAIASVRPNVALHEVLCASRSQITTGIVEPCDCGFGAARQRIDAVLSQSYATLPRVSVVDHTEIERRVRGMHAAVTNTRNAIENKTWERDITTEQQHKLIARREMLDDVLDLIRQTFDGVVLIAP